MHTNITIKLKNGQNYGANAIAAAKKLNPKTSQYEPAISFVCCEIAQVELNEDVKEIVICADTWCPTCQ